MYGHQRKIILNTWSSPTPQPPSLIVGPNVNTYILVIKVQSIVLIFLLYFIYGLSGMHSNLRFILRG